MTREEVSVYEIIQTIHSDFRRLGIIDKDFYAETIAMEICKSLNEGASKDEILQRLKKTSRSALIVPRSKNLDDLLHGIANRFHRVKCANITERPHSGGIVARPKSEFSAFYEIIRIIEESEDLEKILPVID